MPQDCSQPPPWTRCTAGFTLLELMIVLAVVAILSAVAYPAYQDSVIKGKRAQGRAALMDLMQQQERYFTQSGSYMTFAAGATGAAGTTFPTVSGVAIPFKTTSGDNPASASYDLGAELCPGGSPPIARNECVRLVAQPRFTDAQGAIRVTSTGVKDCVKGVVETLCWKQ